MGDTEIIILRFGLQRKILKGKKLTSSTLSEKTSNRSYYKLANNIVTLETKTYLSGWKIDFWFMNTSKCAKCALLRDANKKN
jgi:hypothetical protein